MKETSLSIRRLEQRPEIIDLSKASHGIHSREVVFGLKSKDNTNRRVTINGGPVILGAAATTCEATVVSVGGTINAPHYVFAYGSVSPLTVAISPVTTETFPVHAVNQWRRALIKLYVQSGAIVVPEAWIYWTGLIDLTANYGP